MKWYIDSAHINSELGNLMLDRIFGYPPEGQETITGFGTLISEDNIEAHLLDVRQKRSEYRSTHPNDIAVIENLVQEFNGKSSN